MRSGCAVSHLVLIKAERHWQRMLQQWQDSGVELVEICLPCPIRIYAVCPTDICVITQMLPVIGKEFLTAFRGSDAVSFTKHQHSRNDETFGRCSTILSISTNVFQEFLVIHLCLRMVLVLSVV